VPLLLVIETWQLVVIIVILVIVPIFTVLQIRSDRNEDNRPPPRCKICGRELLREDIIGANYERTGGEVIGYDYPKDGICPDCRR